jgi:hypothetical protein
LTTALEKSKCYGHHRKFAHKLARKFAHVPVRKIYRKNMSRFSGEHLEKFIWRVRLLNFAGVRQTDAAPTQPYMAYCGKV